MRKKFKYKYILVLSLVILMSCALYLASFVNTNTSISNTNSFEETKENISVTNKNINTQDSFVLLSETENKEEKNTKNNPEVRFLEKPEVGLMENIITLEIGDNKTNLPFEEGKTLYQILEKYKNDGKIIFEGKNYPMLGFFVTQIGDLKEGDGKYLFYNINNKEAEVGVSSYKPQNGDIISWELK